MPGVGLFEFALVLVFLLIVVGPLSYLMRRSQRRYDQLDRIERKLDHIDRRLS
jgi:hypothetical protein